MSRPFFYCSDLSRQTAETSFGTASIGEVWLLVEYREAWGTHALQDSSLSAQLKSYLNNLCKTIPRARLLFIKQDRFNQSPLACYVVCCRERAPAMVKFRLTDYEQLLSLDVAAVAAGATLAGGDAVDAPLFLVCTHGKRDKCCAKFGYALYKSLREQAEENVWQSSHVGGDRFAANLVCFPHGLFYAHVTEQTGRMILDEYRQHQVVLENYRGRACYSYPVQAAEFFIRRESHIAVVNELRYLRHERTDETNWLVRFSEKNGGKIHEAHVAARPSEFQNYITCGAAGEQRVLQYVLKSYRSAIHPASVE
ncbi:MAG: sucrase ferredoxin [Pyrinomonadaceae bacterium]